MLEVSTIEAEEMPPPYQYEIAKERIKSALDQFKDAGLMIERFPCLLFTGCSFKKMTEVDTKQIFALILNLSSNLD